MSGFRIVAVSGRRIEGEIPTSGKIGQKWGTHNHVGYGLACSTVFAAPMLSYLSYARTTMT